MTPITPATETTVAEMRTVLPHQFVQWLRDVAPYVHTFHNKTFVIAFGGELIDNGDLQDLVFDVSLLIAMGMRIVLIPGARPAHLVLSLLTLGSWFVLGRWMGEGYCPVSDWHWKIKGAIGEGRPTVTYITFILRKITRTELDSNQVDRVVVVVTITVTLLSLFLNLKQWLT